MIGLDIGSKYIKVCQVERQGAQYRLAAAVMAATPGSQPAGPRSYMPMVSCVRSMLAAAGMVEKATAASVAGQNLLTRSFSFPALSRQELDGAVALEASQSLPPDTAPMYTDYLVMPADYEGKKDVLFAGVSRDGIDQLTQVARRSGMDLTIVDIDHLALANCFLALEPGAGKEAVILLNIGHTQTNLSIVDAGELRFVRNVAFGGRDITRIIAQIMGISEEHAEDLKKNPQIWKECGVNIKDILRRSLPDVLEAIYRSIEYCMNRKKLVCVDRILLTGGSAALPGVSDFMKDALGIAAVPWNPLTRMNIAQKTILDMGYYLTVSIGLGMRESIYV